MDSDFDLLTAKAILEWQEELGISEAISEKPINRFDTKKAEDSKIKVPRSIERTPTLNAHDPIDEATIVSTKAENLQDLKTAIDEFPHCDLKHGARNAVFSAGSPSAKIMIIGEAPGRDEDYQGVPFVGRAGQLLDKMLLSIGFNRGESDIKKSVYITNVIPWRPPENREPTKEEIDMMLPFLRRHIELVDPMVVVAMGNVSCQCLLGRRGITKLRGIWDEAFGVPVLPMLHPAYLLRNPVAKREAWFDLLSLKEMVLS